MGIKHECQESPQWLLEHSFILHFWTLVWRHEFKYLGELIFIVIQDPMDTLFPTTMTDEPIITKWKFDVFFIPSTFFQQLYSLQIALNSNINTSLQISSKHLLKSKSKDHTIDSCGFLLQPFFCCIFYLMQDFEEVPMMRNSELNMKMRG